VSSGHKISPRHTVFVKYIHLYTPYRQHNISINYHKTHKSRLRYEIEYDWFASASLANPYCQST